VCRATPPRELAAILTVRLAEKKIANIIITYRTIAVDGYYTVVVVIIIIIVWQPSRSSVSAALHCTLCIYLLRLVCRYGFLEQELGSI